MIQSSFSVLPFYDSVDQQLHRKSYAYNSVFPLIAYKDFFIPFQFTASDFGVTRIAIHRIDGSVLFTNVVQAFSDAGMRVTQESGVTRVVFPARLPTAISMPQGQFYLAISRASRTVFSEVFTVSNSVKNCLLLEWADIEDLDYEGGTFKYADGFKNKLYIDSQLGKPEYKFEEEGEDRDGFFFPEKRISEKVYKFTFLAPEYLLDALRIVRLSDHVFITDMYGKKYRCDTILMTPKWEAQGNLASVQVEFETGTVVKKLGKGFSPEVAGDFNNDFNSDFNIE